MIFKPSQGFFRRRWWRRRQRNSACGCGCGCGCGCVVVVVVVVVVVAVVVVAMVVVVVSVVSSSSSSDTSVSHISKTHLIHRDVKRANLLLSGSRPTVLWVLTSRPKVQHLLKHDFGGWSGLTLAAADRTVEAWNGTIHGPSTFHECEGSSSGLPCGAGRRAAKLSTRNGGRCRAFRNPLRTTRTGRAPSSARRTDVHLLVMFSPWPQGMERIAVWDIQMYMF